MAGSQRGGGKPDWLLEEEAAIRARRRQFAYEATWAGRVQAWAKRHDWRYLSWWGRASLLVSYLWLVIGLLLLKPVIDQLVLDNDELLTSVVFRGLAVSVLGLMGVVLFWLKKRQLLWYATLELAAATLVAIDTVIQMGTQERLTVGVKAAGAVYLIVRALDNASKALEQRAATAMKGAVEIPS